MKRVKENKIDKDTMIGIICLLIVLSGMFGFVYEYIFYYFNEGTGIFYWRGGNFLPWINIYAIGTVLIFLITYRYRDEPFKVFMLAVIISGLLEYFSGLGIYLIGNGTRYWDYNTEILNFGNIGGFVCLRSVLFFGLSSLVLIYFLIPLLFKLSTVVDKQMFVIISFSLCAIFLFDEIYNLIIARLFSLPTSYDIYSRMGVPFMSLK